MVDHGSHAAASSHMASLFPSPSLFLAAIVPQHDNEHDEDDHDDEQESDDHASHLFFFFPLKVKHTRIEIRKLFSCPFPAQPGR